MLLHIALATALVWAPAKTKQAKGGGKPAAAKAEAEKPLTPEEVAKALKTIDDRLASPAGDYQARFYIEERAPGKATQVSQLVVYRRDADSKLLLIFTKPKTRVGQGYLRVDENLWYYAPSSGRWDRRNANDEVVAGAITADFDKWNLSAAQSQFAGRDALGSIPAYKIAMQDPPNAKRSAYPTGHLWIDIASGNPLKQENRSLSGDLIRTLYFPKWVRAERKGGKEEVYYPNQIRIFGEQAKTETILLVQEVALSPIETGVFTKAWLESQSR